MKDLTLITDIEQMIKTAPELEKDFDIYEYPFLFMEDGKPSVIGELQLGKDDMYVGMIKSLEPGKGHGRTFVEYLETISGKDTIMGDAVPDAVPFWSKMGAVFNHFQYQYYLDSKKAGTRLQGGFTIMFTIFSKEKAMELGDKIKEFDSQNGVLPF